MCRSVKVCIVAALFLMIFKETTSTPLDGRYAYPNQQYLLPYARLDEDMTDFGPFNRIRKGDKENFWKNLYENSDPSIREQEIFNTPYDHGASPKNIPPQPPTQDDGSYQRALRNNAPHLLVLKPF